jgi:hypothetical protein
MQYDKEIVERMVADPRWSDAITPEKAQSWKSRGIIPNHYFNPQYVKCIKQGQYELAKQVTDPYFNENFNFQPSLTEAEKKEHDRVLQLLQNEKINLTKVLLQTGISLYQYINVVRPSGRRIYLLPEQISALNENLQELRTKISNVVSKHDKKGVFEKEDKKEIDEVLFDQRLEKAPLINHKVLLSRACHRCQNQATLSEDNEVKFLLERFALFLRETAK